MQEASLSEVLRVLLIVLLIYFGFKLIIRWFGPIILRYFLKKVGKKFEQKFSQFDPTAGQQQKQGEVTIDKKPNNKRKSKNDVGEYIDYEEID
ncbi:MAG: DUF4834 family protein [Salinimicrobium sediminis]|uniref:DUF4834 domain-containing protein n=1 Tax=Salinimicrobium sediminis TaxID=1343891 RepID=A0A285X3W4_9FLAO|nr:DUF4834 family protein [Salinimicrobium sediminis]MDX1602735.1 DUF4834 family protein [Salinimicrobium sediminis]MDX1754365.1 DUF4834 family protein [Salinimicrobium sediminis]SOC80051.1 protein of unknown function [Salinimicrobium sediminis]